MRKVIFMLLLCLCAGISHAQIKFVPGYFIDETNQKTTCLIKDIDWKNNPTKFDYKISLTDQSQSREIANTTEFGVDNASKYIRRQVKIDRSSQLPSKYSNQKAPEWSEETVFLKVLVEGKVNLYSYEESNLERYFFKVGDNPIEALVYKKYLHKKIDYDGTKMESEVVDENRFFQQQLNLYANCSKEKTPAHFFENLTYNKFPLVKYFIKYNECEGISPSYFKKNTAKADLNLRVLAGLGFANLEVEYSIAFRSDLNFGSSLGYRAGLELEYILPFNKNKWGLFTAGSYQSYQAKLNDTPIFTNSTNNSTLSETVYQHRSFLFDVGARHYFFLSEKSKIFLNLGYSLNFHTGKSGVTFSRTLSFLEKEQLEFTFGDSAFLGLGYIFNNRISLESRYQFPQNHLPLLNNISTHVGGFNVLVGYTIF